MGGAPLNCESREARGRLFAFGEQGTGDNIDPLFPVRTIYLLSSYIVVEWHLDY